MGTATQKPFVPEYTPSETGTKEVKVTVTKDGKEIVKTAKAQIYATAEDLLIKEFAGSMERLLDAFNKANIKAATAVARQACYVSLAGPSKSLYAMARKIYRDSVKFGAEVDPRKAFDLAVMSYSHLPEIEKVEYDESKVVKAEETEEEEESND